MRASARCLPCILSKQESILPKDACEELKTEYLRKVMALMAAAPAEESAPALIAQLLPLYEAYFGDDDPYLDVKQRFNALLMTRRDSYEKDILAAGDSLHRALCLARAGNYIDSASEETPSVERLDELLARAMDEEIPERSYQAFCRDLQGAGSLLYITDNAGEIVLDVLCVQQILRVRPDIRLTTMVRGGPVLNDATIKDAEQVGLMEHCDVVDSGTRIAGIALEKMSPEKREIVEKADMIIAKGQANFESLYGSGLPVYYSFLCKCGLFVERFGLPAYSGVFARERDIAMVDRA